MKSNFQHSYLTPSFGAQFIYEGLGDILIYTKDLYEELELYPDTIIVTDRKNPNLNIIYFAVSRAILSGKMCSLLMTGIQDLSEVVITFSNAPCRVLILFEDTTSIKLISSISAMAKEGDAIVLNLSSLPLYKDRVNRILKAVGGKIPITFIPGDVYEDESMREEAKSGFVFPYELKNLVEGS